MEEYHTNIKYFIKSKKIPLFAQLIFKDENYADEEKFKFKEYFLNKYLKSPSFRKEVEGFYIFFFEHKLFAVYEKKEHIDPKIPGYKLMGYKISENYEKQSIMYTSQINISGGDLNKFNLAKVNCICSFPDINMSVSEKRLIDTGSTYTSIPFINEWDFSKQFYNSEFEHSYALNTNILSLVKEVFDTANGDSDYIILTWRIPLLISVDTLHPVKIKEMIVPIKYLNNFTILGVDVIFRHTVIISSKNYFVDIKFLPSEHTDLENEEEVPEKNASSSIYKAFIDFKHNIFAAKK